MATFTIRLTDLIAMGWDIGLTTYPIHDENYRAGLNAKIINHYSLYEIGLETETQFHFALNAKMNEIMPYYKQLYQSALIQYDPLNTQHVTDTRAVDANGTQTGTANNATNNTTASRSRGVHSEMPQVRLSGMEDYATSEDDQTGDTSVTAESDATNNESNTAHESSVHTISGYDQHAALLLMQYRQSLLNIDMMVINDLSSLFMGLWDSGDSYTGVDSWLYWPF